MKRSEWLTNTQKEEKVPEDPRPSLKVGYIEAGQPSPFVTVQDAFQFGWENVTPPHVEMEEGSNGWQIRGVEGQTMIRDEVSNSRDEDETF